MYTIGVDLGGTNTAAGLVDESGRIVARLSVATSLPTTPERLVQSIASLSRELMARSGLTARQIRSVGVGVPCTAVQETGWMEDASHLGFSAGPLAKPLEQQLCIPVAIGNDADAAAWGEYHGGGYQGKSFLLVTLGTGIGAGIVLGGHLLQSRNGAVGEVGHMAMDPNGPLCGCGRRGCWEHYGSATALILQARQAGVAVTGAKEVFDRAAAGDTVCAGVLDRYTTFLADGFANLINILSPDILCIGGGVSAAGAVLLEPVRNKTAQRVLSHRGDIGTRIVLAGLGNDAGILGAALLEKQEEYK